MSNIEIWKPVEKYPELYEVSSLGNVKVKPRWRNSRHGKILYPDEGLHHPRATLTKAEYLKVKGLAATGLNVNQISNETGIGYNIVYRIVNGISYKYYDQ